jgi:hypothetical protein
LSRGFAPHDHLIGEIGPRRTRPIKPAGATHHMTSTTESTHIADIDSEPVPQSGANAGHQAPHVAVNDIGSAEDFLAAVDKTIK